jgi:hypothetical protein
MRLTAPAVLLSLLVAASGSLRAQGLLTITPADTASLAAPAPDAIAVPQATTAAPREAAGATLTGLRAGVHARETSRPAQTVRFARTAPQSQARAMMIVGVAALIAGAIIGDTPGTIIMVGGTVVGLIGLYEYLQ